MLMAEGYKPIKEPAKELTAKELKDAPIKAGNEGYDYANLATTHKFNTRNGQV